MLRKQLAYHTKPDVVVRNAFVDIVDTGSSGVSTMYRKVGSKSKNLYLKVRAAVSYDPQIVVLASVV